MKQKEAKSEKNSFRISPYSSDLSSNEHWIMARGPDLCFEDDPREMTFAIVGRLKEIFPDGDDRGTRVEIRHMPTEEELTRLRNLAAEFGADLEAELRNEEQYREMRRERQGRSGRS